ncbi:MAG: hypothetical protein RLY31_2123 [Bacteroidota bacterium]
MSTLNDHGFLHMRWRDKPYPPFISRSGITTLLENWDTDEHDIFICTHQKVGTHLTKQFIVELLRSAIDYPPDNPLSTGDIGHHTVAWPEVLVSQYGYGHFQEHLARTAGMPRVWYIHCFSGDLPVRSIHPGTKFVLVFRDPRGAAVSQYFFYRSHPLLQVSDSLTMEDFVPLFVKGGLYFGDYHLHTLDWLAAEGHALPAGSLLVLRYEDLVEQKLAVTARLAAHLLPGVSLPEERALRIAASTAFDTMKQRITDTPGSFHFNPSTFFRAGRPDDWRDRLSMDQVQAIDEKSVRVWGEGRLDCPDLSRAKTLAGYGRI